MATTRMKKSVLVPLLMALAIESSHAFGITKSLLSRNVSPKVQFIPVMASVGKTSIDMIEESSSKATPTQRLPIRWNALTKLRKDLFDKIPKNIGYRMTRKTLLLGLGSIFVTLVCRPTFAVAMGGGMGGSKGPVAPMPR